MNKSIMTPKERMLAAMRGQEVDRLPWSPFLAYLWESLPKEITEKGQLSFLQSIGADPLFRGSHIVFDIVRENCRMYGDFTNTNYETPMGTLTAKRLYSPAGNTWFLSKHPVKTKEDFKILAYIYENTVVKPNFEIYEKDREVLGEQGLYIPLIGTDSKTSFQSMVEYWVGTEELVYALMDYPEVVGECLGAMREVSVRTVEAAVQCSAEAFIFWEDSSTTNISPAYFEKYAAPEINSWGKIIHEADKLLIHHACGHVRGLLPKMANTEIDIIESISPPPTGNIELWQAKDILPEHIGLIGGIEPTVFLRSTPEELEAYVLNLLDKMGNKGRFILANSDSCPPGVSIEKFKLVTDIVNNYK